jgi:hypothetical protein
VFRKRLIGATRDAATDKRIPRTLRWFAVLGLRPAPGPVGEILLLAVVAPLGLVSREPLADA